ncbi:MAG: PaaI family thioesterase [Wohlfahrtiimonas sp.]
MLTIEQMNNHTRETLVGNLGILFTVSEDGYVEATMPVDARTIQSYGYLHGGATIALAETVAGVGTFSIALPEKSCVGMQISASHISSARTGETVVAKGQIVHRGKSTHVWDVNIYAVDDDRLISTIRVTNAIVKNRNPDVFST